MKNWLRRADVILILILVILGAGSWLAIRFLKDQNSPSTIKIRTSDEKFEIALKDTLLTIPGALGETEVRIEDGRVWVTRPSCPQKLCARQGK
ncbi:MAG: NusG domain II-containing protein, partial [candidate division WOR-3 bacterium]|nr:NusG domain II-containing protein [candidate division WOR-3 bacterium]